MKVCAVCKENKPESCFYKQASSKDGLYSRCKTCDKLAGLKYRLKNSEKRKLSIFRRRIKHAYGLTEKEYYELEKKQNYVCKICGRRNKNMRLAIDHDHTTKEVRGLLCNTCNRALGLFDDDLSKLKKAAEYLEQNRT